MNNSTTKELPPLLLLEDEELLSLLIKDYLESKGYKVYSARRCSEALKILELRSINVALVDNKLPDGEGTTVLEYIIENKLKTKMILMTAYGSDKRINEYVRKGAFDFVEKPFPLEQILKRIENANRMFQLDFSQDAVEYYYKPTYQIIGNSPEMEKIKKMIRLIAQAQGSVLIEGETGTGKELVARNIHIEGNRNDKQFISVNCASIPENLFESEFFGYEKGAFTGAYKEKPGFFEIANFGILHMDEIGEMPLEFQAKLLRVLEEGTFIKLGGTKEIQVDVQIIASTNKNLKAEVAAKQFREDLYFRLAVFTIYVPPLRERKDDIPLLAEYLWNELSLKMGKKLSAPGFSLEALKKYPWKGNVRELRNYIEKKLIYTEMQDIEPMGEEYREQTGINPLANEPKKREIKPLDDYIREYVLDTLKYCKYNKAETARLLGLGLSTLKRKLREWGVVVQKNFE
ncbi:MAG: Sigma-54-dependent Fis family transcriptional regulator [Acidobacteriota bacterium]|nr:Sigma-54-dependent Fis family transcriptional regulator [Acidobacteriota bacterium]